MTEEFGHPSIRVSRRERQCEWCLTMIQKGERYSHWWGLADGEVGKYDCHEECEEAIQREYGEFQDPDGISWAEPHNRGMTDWETQEANREPVS